MVFALVTKLGILGGAVYITTKNGIWGDNSDQGVKAFQQMTKNIEDKLPEGTKFTGFISDVNILPKNFDIATTWNKGITKSFNYLVSVPNKCSDLTKSITKSIIPDN